MKTYFDCIPCFMRQTLGAVRLATSREAVHESVLRGVLRAAGEMDLQQSPPEMAHYIHRLIRELSGNQDPYKEVKERFNRMALGIYPTLVKDISTHADPLEAAVRLSIAGNIIDFGVPHNGPEPNLDEAISQALSTDTVGDIGDFLNALDAAENILYLGDNAGEIVFDRLLIERLPVRKITYVVKGGPIINDATMADAVETGMTDLVEVIDNGSDAPGTLLRLCSKSFLARFDAADLIVAKGQANYETLAGVDGKIYFLLKAKCPVIARDIGCPVGSFVVTGCEK
jgi:damage-control phosphatase, subfamily I